MSVTPGPLVPNSLTDRPFTKLLIDHPGADITLRSQVSYHLRVSKIYIANSSPILAELIRSTIDSPSNANPVASTPVVQLQERGEIIQSLFTFIFPVTPVLPSTPGEIMELLSFAQKYQIETALTQIRGSTAQYNSLFTTLEPALHTYALAQKYGLLPEALQAARTILLKQPMAIEDFENKLDIMPGAALYEPWKYYERVQAILESEITEFQTSCAHGTITGLRCSELSSSQIPTWLDKYIESIKKSPNLFDFAKFIIAMARHLKDRANNPYCECVSISSQTISAFWEALASVVHGGFER